MAADLGRREPPSLTLCAVLGFFIVFLFVLNTCVLGNLNNWKWQTNCPKTCIRDWFLISCLVV